jgi:hypothetical protein
MPNILTAYFWEAEEYQGVRDKLASPVPSPVVEFSDAGFITVDSVGAAAGSSPSSADRCELFQSII